MADADLNKLKISRDAKPAQAVSRRRRRTWLIVAFVLAIGAIAATVRIQTAPVTVETAAIATAYPSQSFAVLNATGYVVAQRKAAVASKATGRLEWLGVREGSRVKIELAGLQWRCHRPHPGKEAKRYQVEEAREILERAGVKP